MSTEGTPGSEHGDRSRPVRLSLNSKRLTANQLKRIATALGVPMTAAAGAVRLMMEGKLTENERDPRNVLVVMKDANPAAGFELHNADGPFLSVEPAATTAD